MKLQTPQDDSAMWLGVLLKHSLTFGDNDDDEMLFLMMILTFGNPGLTHGGVVEQRCARLVSSRGDIGREHLRGAEAQPALAIIFEHLWEKNNWCSPSWPHSRFWSRARYF